MEMDGGSVPFTYFPCPVESDQATSARPPQQPSVPLTCFLSEPRHTLLGGGAKHAKLEFRASPFCFFSVVLMSLTC